MRLLASVVVATSLVLPSSALARRLDLPTLIAQAKRGGKAELARAGAEAARAKRAEVRWAWVPLVDVTVIGGPTPEIHCVPSAAECITTEPTETTIGFEGI